ncbi:3 beta-hydroxysteroid dehydrogenase/Delta 5--_4-isomerase type 1-like [Mercenaria mercenaria]|uniref:3 beta-hydroxysteroid dehydrogenase/Delta 5-->4-isomerase type 1-like n=1 Tax=Mercenaria mercenaria TaxID=6596 RepID=UPI00234EAF76|nr:3 beta-hydroxysteroid dehydrogenase/Delta 5-->4-isomerase type 1-like [Mercenaria mercenaria]XP_045172935.2 3 beta-hydroxysteroid dehydrogenase/Delta 5-->4-isomerase type 1-like [Mercenaria mercenaria]
MSRRLRDYVVLVTGSSGFLGQHLVGLLQTHAEHVTEIRVLDTQPYVNKTEFRAKKPVRHFVGSIIDLDLMKEACRGVDCVFHLASIIDISLFADMERSYQINVEGTKTVIEACKTTGVKRLIYCSSAGVILGYDDIIDGREDGLEYPREHLFPVYGKTKQQAEELVIQANGSTLQTASIRPAAIYGDLDWKSLGTLYGNRFTKATGYYVYVDFSFKHTDWVYVGNVAWAFIQADMTLRENKHPEAAGQCYFITDDTPKMEGQGAMFTMVKDSGLKPFPLSPPMWLQMVLMRVFIFVLTFISLFWTVNFSLGKWICYMRGMTWLLDRQKATHLLGYEPLFGPDEVKQRVVKYIRSISN